MAEEGLWTRIASHDGEAQPVPFDTEGLDPAVLRCVRKRMVAWTVLNAGMITGDWPLRLRLVRSGAPTP